MRVLPILALALALCAALPAVAKAEDRAVILLSAQSEAGRQSTFGTGSVTGGPLARAVAGPVKAAGLAVAPLESVATPEPGAGALPTSDEAAIAVAQAAGAALAVVVGVTAKSEGKLRATAQMGYRAEAYVRVLDVATSRSLFDARAKAAAYGASPGNARSRAGSKALSRALRGLTAKLMVHGSAGQPKAGRLALNITGADGWRAIASILRSLAATRGVSDVAATEIRPGRVVLSIASQQGAAQVVESLRRTRIYHGTLAVQLAGAVLDVRVVMSSPSTTSPVPNG